MCMTNRITENCLGDLLSAEMEGGAEMVTQMGTEPREFHQKEVQAGNETRGRERAFDTQHWLPSDSRWISGLGFIWGV